MSAPHYPLNESLGYAERDENLARPSGDGESVKQAPDEIKTNFGTLEFEGGAFPTEESVKKIYNEMELQRATQADMDFFPAMSIYGILRTQIRDFGFKTSSDVGVMADFMFPSENYLTRMTEALVFHAGTDSGSVRGFSDLEEGLTRGLCWLCHCLRWDPAWEQNRRRQPRQPDGYDPCRGICKSLGSKNPRSHLDCFVARDLRASYNDGPTESAFGWGGSASGKVELPFLAKEDFLTISFTYGEGIGSKINDQPLDAIWNSASSNLATVPVLG